MPDFTMPSRDDLQPLLKKARTVGNRDPDSSRAVALFDPETGELLSGPKLIHGSERVDWTQDGIEVTGRGAFCSYDGLKQSWNQNKRQRDAANRQFGGGA